MASELSPVPNDLAFDATIRGLNNKQQVFGRYSLRRILGRGGMGVVWLGFDERLERDVALKFLPEEVFFDPGALDELKRETRRCLELTHPNIIRIYDFAKDEQAAAISMEYIDGQTLAALRTEQELRVFEVDDIKQWMIKACEALHYAHEEVGVVHRDLKPANLMLTSRGQIKIADFGIAQRMGESMSRLTMRRGSSSGTLAYMSPQQLNGDMPKVTDDIYALGTTIYEMLTGKPPFYSGDIPFQVRVAMPRSMTERRRELEIVGNEIPQQWEDAIASCLAKIPAERPKTMLELAERLRFSSLPPLKSTPSPRPKIAQKKAAPAGGPPPLPLRPFPTRRVLQISGAALGAGALLVGSAVYLLHGGLFAKPGELRFTSNPPGATVHLTGFADRLTPVDFAGMRPGTYKVVISSENYEPMERDVTLSPGMKLDLGTLTLERSFGNLDLATVPLHAHYKLVGAANTGNFQKEGSTPDVVSDLPAGTYQIVLSAPKFPSYTGTIQVPAHETKSEAADLTQLGLASTASPAPAKVIRGEMDAGQLDGSAKAELAELYNKAFEEYFASGLLGPASDELGKLKGMGENTDAQEKRLAEKRAAAENDFAGKIIQLVAAGKFATAEEKFKNINGALEKQSVDRLQAEFQSSLSQYQQQIDAAVKSAQNEPLSSAYQQLKTLVKQYPDDLQLELALADVQTEMPPDHEFLSTQVEAFQQFSDQNKDFASEPALVEKQAAFTEELKQLDALAAALSAAKSGPTKIKNQIASLEERKRIFENRRVGHSDANPFTQTINFFGKAVTGHAVVDNAAYFSSQHQKRAAIEDVESEIESAKLSLAQPQTSVDQAQKNYDDFVAKVPWGDGASTPAVVVAPAAGGSSVNATGASGSTAPPLAPPPDLPAKL